MTANELNLRINLQAFCDANGQDGYQFIKMPIYGWFAINKKDGVVRNLFDFIPADQMVEFCTDLILNRKQYHDSKIFYSEMAVRRLANDVRIKMTFRRMLQDAQAAFAEGEAFASGKHVNLRKMFNDNGMRAFESTGVGYVTEAIYNAYRVPLGLGKANEIRNRLLIPSFCTPNHFCSLELCQIDQPAKRLPLFIDVETGWHGKPEKMVHPNFTALLTNVGCTWDYKLDYWVDSPLGLSEELDVGQCLKIWKEGKNIRFKRSPLDIIESNNAISKLRLNLDQLNCAQVRELETRFKVPLLPTWTAQKKEHVRFDDNDFVYKDGRYYIETQFGLQELCNFAMEIDKIIQRGDQFFRVGVIFYEGKEIPFEINNRAFATSRTFLIAMSHYFLSHGIGVPIFSSKYGIYTLDVINRLNMNALTNVAVDRSPTELKK